MCPWVGIYNKLINMSPVFNIYYLLLAIKKSVFDDHNFLLVTSNSNFSLGQRVVTSPHINK